MDRSECLYFSLCSMSYPHHAHTHTNTRKAHSKFNLKSAQEENFYFSVQCDEKISFSRDMFFL